MIRLENKHAVDAAFVADTTLTLDFDARQKSRQRVTLDDGREAGVLLPRGSVLLDGDVLHDAQAGVFVRVVAAAELVSHVYCADRLRLNRICYHLGNRHVPLQIGEDTVAYRHDHVLDAMVSGLGVTPTAQRRAFQPEPGAYEGQGHTHSHGHHHGQGSHAHQHAHDHPHDAPV